MKNIFTLAAILFSATAFAQSGVIKGQLKDTASKQNLQGATISVLDKDSTLISFGIAKADGAFQVNNVPFGSNLLLISFQGFRSEYRTVNVSKENPVSDLGTIMLTDVSKDLGNVTVVNAPVTIKGDTTEFNANSFKTKPNASTEDLLKKLPGVQVEKDGTVKAQGENVKRVLVDGKKFFGDDPKMATKNLPADVIDKVQVYDAQSDQSAFSGFDDGNREKTINIVTKKDKRKGYFGKASAGAGDNERYAANVSVNRFNGNQQISFIGQANNTNQQNFSMQDILGTMGGSGMFGSSGGGMQMMSGGGRGMSNMSNFLGGGTQAGIARTIAGGLNYNDAWSKNTSVSGSYFYNNMNVLNGSDRLEEFFQKNDSSLFSRSNNYSINKNQNHRFNFEIDHKIDSFNSILIRPSFSFQESNSYSQSDIVSTKGRSALQNDQLTQSFSDNQGYNFNNSILFRHRFRKRGRTISLNLTQAFNSSETDRRNLNYFTLYNPITLRDTSDFISDLDRQGKTFGGNLSYTEPIDKKSQMEMNYNYSNNSNTSDQFTQEYNKSTGKYVEEPGQTNDFKNISLSHRFGVNYRRQINKEWNYTVGMAVQYAELTSDNKTKDTYLSQSFKNFFPTLSIQYSKNRVKNLRFNYRGSTRQPNISQLQDVIDSTNRISIRRGNAALGQEFTNNFSLFYTMFDIFTFKNFFAGVNGGFTSNKISNYIITNFNSPIGITEDGVRLVRNAQYTRPVNLNGAYNLSAFMNYGFPIRKIKANVNLTTTVLLNQDVSLIRDLSESAPTKNYTKNYVLAERVSFTMNLKERLDLNFSSTSTYTIAKYSRQTLMNNNYFSQMFSMEPTYSTKKGWIFALDFDYNFYRGQSEEFNQSVPLLNASISKQVFKNKAGEIKLYVFDMLKQNQSITRTVKDNSIEDVNTQVLQRYFMLSFTYNLRKFGQNAMPGFFNMFRGTPMPGSGGVRIVN